MNWAQLIDGEAVCDGRHIAPRQFGRALGSYGPIPLAKQIADEVRERREKRKLELQAATPESVAQLRQARDALKREAAERRAAARVAARAQKIADKAAARAKAKAERDAVRAAKRAADKAARVAARKVRALVRVPRKETREWRIRLALSRSKRPLTVRELYHASGDTHENAFSVQLSTMVKAGSIVRDGTPGLSVYRLAAKVPA